MTPHGPEPAVYEKRRRALLDRLRSAVLFIPGPPEAIYANDVHYRYRPDTNIRYLSGFDEPSHLLLSGCEHERGLTLFVRPRDPAAETWTGKRAGVDGARAEYGADFAYTIDEWAGVLERHLKDAERLYWMQSRDNGVNERVLSAIRAANALRPRSGRESLVIEDATPLLGEMRVIKQPDELSTLRTACRVSAEAHRAIMEAIHPGDVEYQVEALIEYLFRNGGCSGPAYGSIAAAGANATVLHYTQNDRTLADGDLLLLDAGGEYGGYCGDITRTFPISARYTDAQARLYDIVLAAQGAAIAAVKPGETVESVHNAALEVLVAGLIDVDLVQGDVGDLIARRSYERFYMHRTSHWLGMDVHDAGRYAIDGKSRELAEGMVLTVEPGLYVPTDDASEFRGIGIRIEDDVLVTAHGAEVLTAAAPKDRGEIEKLRGRAIALGGSAHIVPALRLR
jgi:Xaa-Pro aminopeptidase